MLWLLLFLVLLAFVLAAVLWGGSLFGHSYFYTEIAAGLMWRAAVAAGILVFFFFCWSMINVAGGKPATGELPYPEFWRFSNRIYLVDSPVSELTSKKKNLGEPTLFKLDKTQPRGTNYRITDGVENWSSDAVEWISLKHDGIEYKFDYVKGDQDAGYRRFVDKEHGWEMRDVEIGQPSYTSFLRLVVYFVLNVLHLCLWVAVVWLVLRFSLSHAVVLAFILWLTFTVLVFPVLFANVQAAIRA